jgi:hypothetical protein
MHDFKIISTVCPLPVEFPEDNEGRNQRVSFESSLHFNFLTGVAFDFPQDIVNPAAKSQQTLEQSQNR